MEGLLPIRTNGPYTFDYPFGVGGEELGLYSAGTSAWFDQNVPMGRRVLVKYGSTLRMLHANKLGTTTVVTDQTGAELGDMLYYPWGQAWTNTGLPYDRHFAGMKGFESPEHLYPTDFRNYTRDLGRWMTPDPLAGDVTNPQSFNRYAYVTNNPTSFIDPLGLEKSLVCTNIGGQQTDCTTTDYGGSSGSLAGALASLPGGCADVYVDGLYEGNTCSSPYFGGGGSYPTFVYPPGTSPGGGGNASASKPPGPPANPAQAKGNVFTCAAGFASKYSIAGGLQALGIGTSGASGFITNALGGNMFSGLTNLVQSFRSGSAGGHSVFYNMGQRALAGPSQGLPGIRGPWGASVSDVATGAIAGAYYNGVTGAGETLTTLTGEVGLSSATMTAAEFAAGVGIAKFVYDAASYGVGLVACSN